MSDPCNSKDCDRSWHSYRFEVCNGSARCHTLFVVGRIGFDNMDLDERTLLHHGIVANSKQPSSGSNTQQCIEIFCRKMNFTSRVFLKHMASMSVTRDRFRMKSTWMSMDLNYSNISQKSGVLEPLNLTVGENSDESALKSYICYGCAGKRRSREEARGGHRRREVPIRRVDGLRGI